MRFFKPNVQKLKAKRNVKGLIKALGDSDWAISGDAAKALGEIGDKSAVPALINNLSQGPGIRPGLDLTGFPPLTIGVVLGGLADSTAVLILIECLADSDPNVREGAAEALGGIGDASAAAPLIKLLEDSQSSVRCAAMRSLGKIGDKSTVPHLVKILEESDELPEVNWAAQALGNIGDKSIVPNLRKAQKEKSPPPLWWGPGNIQFRSLPGIEEALEKLGD